MLTVYIRAAEDVLAQAKNQDIIRRHLLPLVDGQASQIELQSDVHPDFEVPYIRVMHDETLLDQRKDSYEKANEFSSKIQSAMREAAPLCGLKLDLEKRNPDIMVSPEKFVPILRNEIWYSHNPIGGSFKEGNHLANHLIRVIYGKVAERVIELNPQFLACAGAGGGGSWDRRAIWTDLNSSAKAVRLIANVQLVSFRWKLDDETPPVPSNDELTKIIWEELHVMFDEINVPKDERFVVVTAKHELNDPADLNLASSAQEK